MIVCSFNNTYNYFIKNKNFNDIYMSLSKYTDLVRKGDKGPLSDKLECNWQTSIYPDRSQPWQ